MGVILTIMKDRKLLSYEFIYYRFIALVLLPEPYLWYDYTV